MTRITDSSTGSRINVMLDLETLGTSPGCKILGIGATTFTTGRRDYETFEIYISRTKQDMLVEEKSTVEWWEKQDAEAKALVLNPLNNCSIEGALNSFADWLRELEGTPVIWANSPSFDCRILELAYKIYGQQVPWNFRNEMCFRTLKNLPHGVPAPAFGGIKHSPLADATFQAQWAEDICKSERWEL